MSNQSITAPSGKTTNLYQFNIYSLGLKLQHIAMDIVSDNEYFDFQEHVRSGEAGQNWWSKCHINLNRLSCLLNPAIHIYVF